MNKKRVGEALERPDLAAYRQMTKLPVKVLLDDIRSLSNVGSIFRTCDAFKVDEVVLCGITGQPPHRDIQRTALGATESVRWSYEPNIDALITRWKQEGDPFELFSLEQCEESITPHALDKTLPTAMERSAFIAVVLGNEVNGVRQSVIDASMAVVEIPQSGTKHSLNVTVAAGVLLWEIYKILELK